MPLWAGFEYEVYESSTQVMVDMTATTNCSENFSHIGGQITIELNEPLGTRELVDGNGNEPRYLEPGDCLGICN